MTTLPEPIVEDRIAKLQQLSPDIGAAVYREFHKAAQARAKNDWVTAAASKHAIAVLLELAGCKEA